MNRLSAKKDCSPVKGEVYNFRDTSMQARTERFFPTRIRRVPRFRVEGEGKPRSHGSRGHHAGPIFSAGQPVAQTGIYEVLHHGDHRSAHEVVMLSGDSFPPCDTCAGSVRFRLIRTAPYIFQDEDFEEQE
jgi:hypothetical protein